jgi:peptidoglycan/LPS O-acetylase OafA/YrhL
MEVLNHRRHLRSLDGLRGLAILMVFGFHFYPGSQRDLLWHLSTIGWLGVDLFFVLSGFLITGTLYDTLKQPKFFGNFYARRGLRLFPVYIVVVAVVLLISHLLGSHLNGWAFPYFFYGSNIVRDAGKDIGVYGGIDVSHFWSLAVEEQFYFIWPFIVLLAATKRRIFWTCIVGSALAVALRWISTTQPHFILGSPFFELPMRLDSLLSGGALAMLLRCSKAAKLLSKTLLNIIMVTGALLLAFGLLRSTLTNSYIPQVRYAYFGSTLMFFSLVAVAIHSRSWAHRIGALPTLRMLGRYSYGLYLIHFLPAPQILRIYASVKYIYPNAFGHFIEVLIFLMYFALALGVSALSYHYIELPLLRLKKYFAYQDEQESHYLQADQFTVVATDAP